MFALAQLVAFIYFIHYVTADVKPDLNIDELNVNFASPVGPECTLQKDEGNCDKNLEKYFFDASTKRCKPFNYTGCGGNLNNFWNENTCNNRCVCSNPKDIGSGTERKTKYFYNSETGKCESFIYRGSGGNANRFFSMSACQSVCESAGLPGQCKARPAFGNVCNTAPTVQFYYDKFCNCCRKFTYLGCGGSKNRFETRAECQHTCKIVESSSPVPPTPPPKPTYCYFQNVFGDCHERVTRYYYNNNLGRCIPFTYSGCGGNENNFITQKMCRQTCGSDLPTFNKDNGRQVTKSPSLPMVTVPTKVGKPTEKLVPSMCDKNPDKGNCIFNLTRYYFDIKTGTCRTFSWSGCGGNSNKFINKDHCEKVCMPAKVAL